MTLKIVSESSRYVCVPVQVSFYEQTLFQLVVLARFLFRLSLLLALRDSSQSVLINPIFRVLERVKFRSDSLSYTLRALVLDNDFGVLINELE